MKNFSHNHLYYFVPEFIEYLYDEFNSLFDSILIIMKLLISVSGISKNISLGKFYFLILFYLRMFFSFCCVYKLKFHSYLFMKNFFLNITKVCLFFWKTIILIIALLFGRNEIENPLFLLISIYAFLTIMPYMYFIYNPFSFFIIQKKYLNGKYIFLFIYIF